MPIQRPQKGRPLRSGRTELAPYASSLVVSDIAEADSSAGQVVQVPGLSPQSKLVGGGGNRSDPRVRPS
jgi:hypothetical protein